MTLDISGGDLPAQPGEAGIETGASHGAANDHKMFRRLWDMDYRYLVPVIPPLATLSPKSHIGSSQRGKAPGVRYSDGTWGGIKDWQTREPTLQDIDAWTAMGASCGLRLGRQHDGTFLYAIDADTLHRPSADIILAHVERIFGLVPVRIGRAPKALYLVRTSDPLPYRVLRFLEGAVEILGQAKQCVMVGVHPSTGKPYRITRQLPPLADLPLHDAAGIEGLLRDLRAALPEPQRIEGTSGGDRTKVNQRALMGDPEMVARAIAAIPNTYQSGSYPAWIKVAAALRAALPEDYGLGLELFEDFTERGGCTEPTESAARVFGSIEAPFSVGASWLYERAAALSDGEFNAAEPYFDADAAAACEAADAPSPAEGGGIEPADIFGNADPVELAEPPPGSMPGILDRWARDEARRKGVSVAFTAAAGLATVGAAIGCSLTLRSRLCDDRQEPAALWVVLVADPGSTKSPVIKEAMRPLRRLDRERYVVDQAKHVAWVAGVKKLPKGALPTEPEPKIRRFVVDDVTMEMQVRIHVDNPRGITRAPDEFMGLLGSLGAYKKGAQTDRSQMLRMFDGDAITVDRVGTGSRHADSALMGVLAGTQPDALRTLTRDLGADGLLQRCLFVVHDGQRRPELDEHPDKAAAEAYDHAVRTLAAAGAPGNAAIGLSREAYDVLMQANAEIDAMRDFPGASKEWVGHVSKWGKILPRLVLIFHALEHIEAFDGVLPGGKVDRATAERAVRFGRFLLRHSLRFYETYFGVRAEASEARKIAGYILTKPELVRITRRDVYDARTNLRGAENLRALQSAMRELERAGWLDPVEFDAHGAKAWIVNPIVHQRFKDQAQREREERGFGRERIMRAKAAKEWLTDDGPTANSA